MRDERGIVQVTVVTATLSCGDLIRRTTIAAKNPVDVLSAKPVKQLATRLCR